MIRFEDLIVGLMELVPLTAGDPEKDGTSIAVTELEITTPIEARLENDGLLKSTLPRGRMATGFDAPHSRLYARFETRGE